MVNDEGFWEPDPEVHHYMGKLTATAFSYNSFILNTCYSLFHWLDVLGKILDKNLPENNSYQNLSLSNILDMISQVEENFFPDEYKRAYIQVTKKDDGFSIEYPYSYPNLKKNKLLLEVRVIGGMDFNPRTSSSNQKIPYMNLTEACWQ